MVGQLRNSIPNFVTGLNLVCGFLGIIEACSGQLLHAAYFIFAACGFDFVDGFVARILNVKSVIGKELDSLADVVSFGVLPGIILYKLASLGVTSSFEQNNFPSVPVEWYMYACVLFPLCAAFRLATFNVSTDQTDGFIGLPTPAAALAIASLPMLYQKYIFNIYPEISLAKFIPYIFTVTLSLLMVSRIKLMALKFKDATFQNNRFKYIFILVAVVMGFTLKFLSILFIIASYLIISIVANKYSPPAKYY